MIIAAVAWIIVLLVFWAISISTATSFAQVTGATTLGQLSYATSTSWHSLILTWSKLVKGYTLTKSEHRGSYFCSLSETLTPEEDTGFQSTLSML